jgi:rubrerythrin
MPEFSNSFSGLTANRKVTHEELVRAIRFMIAAEYEAVQLYMQLAESTDNPLAQVVLKDIADEEIVHAGEFLRLLKELAPGEQAFYAEGETEVEEMMAVLSGTAKVANPGEESAVVAAESPASEIEVETEGASQQAEEQTEFKSPPRVGDLFEKY